MDGTIINENVVESKYAIVDDNLSLIEFDDDFAFILFETWPNSHGHTQTILSMFHD